MLNNWTSGEMGTVLGVVLVGIGGAVWGGIKLALRAVWAYLRERLTEMQKDIDRAQASTENVTRDFAAFKTQVAIEYATHDIVAANQRSTEEAIKGLYTRLDRQDDRFDDKLSGMTDRLDRVLENLQAAPRRRT